MKTMSLQETSRVLQVPLAELRRLVGSHPALRAQRSGTSPRFRPGDLPILRELLRATAEGARDNEISAPVERTETPMPERNAEILPRQSELPVDDIIRAVYAGGRRQEAALDALRNRIRAEGQRQAEEQRLAEAALLTAMRAEFAEMITKLDRHGRLIEDLKVSQHGLVNRLKRADNRQAATRAAADAEPAPLPLPWYEKLYYSFFQPWKLRTRA